MSSAKSARINIFVGSLIAAVGAAQLFNLNSVWIYRQNLTNLGQPAPAEEYGQLPFWMVILLLCYLGLLAYRAERSSCAKRRFLGKLGMGIVAAIEMANLITYQ